MFKALTEAAATKEATLVVELTACFHQASNISWARNMGDAGEQVFHGVVGLKTHCKLAWWCARQAAASPARDRHLGTRQTPIPSYRPLLHRPQSAHQRSCTLTSAVHMVFNFLTAHSQTVTDNPLLVAPVTMAQGSLRLIRREQSTPRPAAPRTSSPKTTGLLEPSVIEALDQASQAGVEISTPACEA